MGPKSVTKSSAAAAGHEPLADRLEVRQRSGLESQVVEPAAAEHRRLAVGLGVPLYLEDVELGPVADLDDGEAGAAPVGELGSVVGDLGVEDLPVEVLEA